MSSAAVSTSTFTLTSSSLSDTLSTFLEKKTFVVTFDKISFNVMKNAFAPPEEVDVESCKFIFEYLCAFGDTINILSKSKMKKDDECPTATTASVESETHPSLSTNVFIENAISRAKVFLFKDASSSSSAGAGAGEGRAPYGCYACLSAKDLDDEQDVKMCTFFNHVFENSWRRACSSGSSNGLMAFYSCISGDNGVYEANMSPDLLKRMTSVVDEKKALYGIFKANFTFTSGETAKKPDSSFGDTSRELMLKNFVGIALENGLTDFYYSELFPIRFSSDDSDESHVDGGGSCTQDPEDDKDWETDEDEDESGGSGSTSSSSGITSGFVRLLEERMRREAEVQDARHERRRTKEIEKTERDLPAREAISISGDCLICMSNPKTVAIVPCGHVVCCDPCSSNLNKMALTDKTVCPVCRTEVSSFLRLFD